MSDFKSLQTLGSTPFFFFPSLRATVLWYFNSGPSTFTLPSYAVSQTAKLDDAAFQRAENSCMKPSNHLDKPSLKRPGNVTPLQTHLFHVCFPPSVHLQVHAEAVRLHLRCVSFPPSCTLGGKETQRLAEKDQIDKCFLSLLTAQWTRVWTCCQPSLAVSNVLWYGDNCTNLWKTFSYNILRL